MFNGTGNITWGKKKLAYLIPVHSCILREPPPFGPKTFTEAQLEDEIVKHESTEEFINYVKDFIKREDSESLDDQIEKLEALKRLLEPQEPADSVFINLSKRLKS